MRPPRTRKKPQGWDTRYYHNTQSENADQVEWQAVLRGSAHMSAGTADDELSESADQDTFPNARSDDLLQGKEIIVEAVQGGVQEIIVEREQLLGALYPFRAAENSIFYEPRQNYPVYELLLGITQSPSLTEGDYAKLPRIFEEISKLAGMGYLGPEARGYRTGWPRPETVARFKDLVDDLYKVTGKFGSEWEWSPEIGLPEDPAPAFVKEEGLDVVIWRSWVDQRSGQLFLLGQCACGSNWLGKGTDLDMRKLRQWCKLPRVDPVRSLFTPRYAVKFLLHDLSLTAGLIFDRVRIVQSLQANHLTTELNQISPLMAEALRIAKGPYASAIRRTSSSKDGRAI